MTDLEIAKSELYEENLTLAIVKNGEVIYSTKSHRISGFLDAIDSCGAKLEGACVADKVAGKAIALLCAYAKVREVFAAIMSRSAQTVFKKHNISCYWTEMVEKVLDTSKAGTCPFEKTAANISDPEQAYKSFKVLLKNLKGCKK